MVRSPNEINKIVKRCVSLMATHYPVKAAYLFGSYKDGNPREDSDIDLAIFCEKIEGVDIDAFMELIRKIQKQVDAPVELHLLPASKLKDVRPTNFVGHITSHGMKIAA